MKCDSPIKSSTSEFLIRVRAMPSDVPPELRIRRLLKIAGRSLKLRCTDISAIEGEFDAAESRDQGVADGGLAARES